MEQADKEKVVVHWFRRDLRLLDNTALYHATKSGFPVILLFIFDDNILSELARDDARVSFIYQELEKLNRIINRQGASLLIKKGNPIDVWNQLLLEFNIDSVFFNKDYEPYALERDNNITKLLHGKGVKTHAFKDVVIFEEDEKLKDDETPYTIFTPYKRKWLSQLKPEDINILPEPNRNTFYPTLFPFPSITDIGFKRSTIKVKDHDLSVLKNYPKVRDVPIFETSNLGPHLRFGTISVRQIIKKLTSNDEVFLSELIWREFFMQILYHFPRVVTENFKVKYNGIEWRNNEAEFEKWSKGETGYPLVDAGMRQLNATGYMHNRIRMVVASFLCKHLLVDWRWGEAYFAQKLFDYELSSNNGNWQWAASTGCDAVPYFRIFNPSEQIKKFDAKLDYVRNWVPEFGTSDYVEPIVEHRFARERAITEYKNGIRRG